MTAAASVLRTVTALAVLAFVTGCATNAAPSASHSRSDAMNESEKRRLIEQTSNDKMCSQRPMGTIAGLPY